MVSDRENMYDRCRSSRTYSAVAGVGHDLAGGAEDVHG